MYRNGEGYYDPVAGKAVRNASRPPDNVRLFRKGVKLLCDLLNVRVSGKIVVIDENGEAW